MQRIEADAIRSQLACQFDQRSEVGEIPDPPIARRPDTIKLYRQQPAAIEVTAESLRRDEQHDGNQNRDDEEEGKGAAGERRVGETLRCLVGG